MSKKQPFTCDTPGCNRVTFLGNYCIKCIEKQVQDLKQFLNDFEQQKTSKRK